MKSVLMSIKPKYCELIANGKKTIEFRKTRPKDTPFKCYIYCTKAKDYFSIGNGIYACSDELYRLPTGEIKFGDSFELEAYSEKQYNKNNFLNGKVIGEFICNKTDIIYTYSDLKFSKDCTLISYAETILKYGCLSLDELIEYANNKEYIYGWHISDLKIYDEPKELKRFGRFECEYCGIKKECFAPETIYCCSLQRIDTRLNNNMYRCDGDFLSLKRPPQSWCYVEELRE